MTLYKIQNKSTGLFCQKRLFYWTEKSRWNKTGTIWISLSDIAKYLAQISKYDNYSPGLDISDWQIVTYTSTVTDETPAHQILIQHL